jgi:hypothetical protein
MKGGLELQGVQTILWRLITAPEGAAHGAEALRREGVLATRDLRSLLRPSASLSPTERVDVYADMYFYRLRDCLAEDYPNLAKWVGPQHFHNLVTDYLLAHPSRHYSLRELGRALPGFLVGHPLANRFPLAPGLAILEWARVDVFDEADADPLSRDALLERAAADPERCLLALVPAARLVRLEAGVLPLWRRLEDDEDAEQPRSETAAAGAILAACVWRRDFAVFHRSLTSDEARCLSALADAPTGLAALGDVLLEGEGADPEAAGARFGGFLDHWTADALLRDAPNLRGY